MAGHNMSKTTNLSTTTQLMVETKDDNYTSNSLTYYKYYIPNMAHYRKPSVAEDDLYYV